jgi:hypothetical protein
MSERRQRDTNATTVLIDGWIDVCVYKRYKRRQVDDRI